MQGNFGPSEAEFDTALRLNPGDAEILTFYSAWAPAFGHPERADHAIRLNPNYQPWQAWNFSYAYFSAGQFEDALRILERLSKGNYNFYSWVYRAASYAALGRAAEAKAATSDALQHFPDHRGFHRDRGQRRVRPSPASGRCGPRGSRPARNPRLWRKTHNWCACLCVSK
jgi:tetratricopeptide (TPR) repeat protein